MSVLLIPFSIVALAILVASIWTSAGPAVALAAGFFLALVSAKVFFD